MNITDLQDKLKLWWVNNPLEHDELFKTLIIDGYKFLITSGHRAFLNAKKDGIELTIFDLGTPDTEIELKAKLNLTICKC
jgi:hypothetical protein